jgi:pyruvate dehydrogenase E1 component
MPEFWQFPTVSMGLGPLMAIYHARFLKYLTNRGIINASQSRVWCFMGDGESDEPESLGALSLAGREHLDNLTFVVDCNLQRLDGPVRGNGKVIQELESVFTGAGWNVIKAIWGGDWDAVVTIRKKCTRPTRPQRSTSRGHRWFWQRQLKAMVSVQPAKRVTLHTSNTS